MSLSTLLRMTLLRKSENVEVTARLGGVNSETRYTFWNTQGINNKRQFSLNGSILRNGAAQFEVHSVAELSVGVS